MLRVLAVMTLTLTAGCSVFGGKAAEEVPYEIVREDGAFEIRDYPTVPVARVTLPGQYSNSSSKAFELLFDYISGANAGDRDISMTAPVFMQGRELSMTAPVFGETGPEGFTMEFALPPPLTADDAPVPTDPMVNIAERPPVRMAVLRFSGLLRPDSIAEQSKSLLTRIADEGLTPAGSVQSAGYNPPWTIPAFRRNEVLVPIRLD